MQKEVVCLILLLFFISGCTTGNTIKEVACIKEVPQDYQCEGTIKTESDSRGCITLISCEKATPKPTEDIIGEAITILKENKEYRLEAKSNFDELTIASWDLNNFDDTKASNINLMVEYASLINNYDIIFIQGIQDSSAFNALCSLLLGYECEISSKSEKASQQYGVIYRDSITIESFQDYSGDKKWKNPPIALTFNMDDSEITVYTLKTDPNKAASEITYLEDFVERYGRVIVLGNLHADCNSYIREAEKNFVSWEWIIEDGYDTTTGSDDCTYDRIILNEKAYSDYLAHGIIKTIPEEISSNYLVWIKIEN